MKETQKAFSYVGRRFKATWMYLGVAFGSLLMRFAYTDQPELDSRLATITIVFSILWLIEALTGKR